MNMKVLLTGATGFLGSEIARELTRQGHTLRVLVRKTSKLDGLKGLVYEKVEGDVTDAASVDRALDGVDALIHTAGNTSTRRRDREALYRVNVDGTRTVLAGAAQRKTGRVVVTSSIVSVGASADPVALDEGATWNTGGRGYHYVDSKRQGEEIALEFAKNGMNLVVLNPSMIMGPGDVYLTSTKLVLEYMKGRNRFWFRGGLSYCDVREVAKAHVTALTKGRSGERYIVAGPNKSYKELQEELYRITGLYKPRRVPYPLLLVAAALSEAAATIAPHSLEDLNLAVVKHAKLFSYYDSSKAERELGYVVRPFDEMLRDTIRDQVARGLAKPSTQKLQGLLGAAA
jgi:dihydroflavonol-4-reductase